jgi:hypothetical protein
MARAFIQKDRDIIFLSFIVCPQVAFLTAPLRHLVMIADHNKSSLLSMRNLANIQELTSVFIACSYYSFIGEQQKLLTGNIFLSLTSDKA